MTLLFCWVPSLRDGVVLCFPFLVIGHLWPMVCTLVHSLEPVLYLRY